MENFFEEIITNPAEFLDSGLLQLKRRVDPSGEQHGCKVGCSANMCKGELFCIGIFSKIMLISSASRTGEELDAFMARNGGWESWDRVVYVGDGGNDFCPLLRLRA